MRHGTASRRQRNRGHGGGGGGGNNNNGRRNGPQRTQVFDSNGPDVRIRGTAHQVAEKYMTLAKDAASAGDRILEESYLQHAEHYQRVINSFVGEGVQERRPEASDQADDENPYTQQQPHARSTGAEMRSDLALPASILGASPKQESQAIVSERTPEVTAT